MSQDWYLLSGQPTYQSGFEIDEFSNYASDGIQELLSITSPISSAVQIVKPDLTVVSDIRAIVQNNLATNQKESYQRNMIVPIGTLETGNYIKYENRIWFVISLVGNNKLFEMAVMQFCPSTLKFQNSSGTILSYPYFTDNDTASVQDGKIISTSDSRKAIKLPYDLNTMMFHGGQRFLGTVFNGVPQVWKIYDLDMENGLLTVHLEKDQYNEKTDRADLGVADYFEIDNTTPSAITKIVYTDSPEIKVGAEKTFRLTHFYADGTTEPMTGTWTLTVPTEFTDLVTTEQTEEYIKIKLKYDDDLIGATLHLKATCYTNIDELDIKVVGYFNG